MTISTSQIRQYLDELHISTTIDEDGDLMLVQSADEEFGHDVVIFIIVRNNRLSYIASARDYDPGHPGWCTG